MEDIIYLQYKNTYGYVIQQMEINYTKKEFKLGQFKIGADKTITKKAFNEKREELLKLGFKEIIKL